MANMKHSTHSVTIEAPFDVAYDYISNWRTQTEWATSFAKAIREENGQIIMTTPQGDAPIDWRTNRELGTVDIIFPTGDGAYSRLFANGNSLQYTFTFSLPVTIPDEVFQQGQINMDEELVNLKRIVEAKVKESA
jgi:hypothetical protein